MTTVLEEGREKVRLMEYRAAGIPPRLCNERLSMLKPRNDEQARAIDRCMHLVRTFKDHYVSPNRPLKEYPADTSTIGRGLCLVGPPGTGKTTIATLMLVELWERWPGLFHHQGRGRRDDRQMRFMPVADLIKLQIDGMRKDDEDGIRQELKVIESAVLLVLDDLGREHKTATKYAEDEVHRLIRSRHRNACPTVVTTNVLPKDWDAAYGESMASFMQEAFEVVALPGRDLRRCG